MVMYMGCMVMYRDVWLYIRVSGVVWGCIVMYIWHMGWHMGCMVMYRDVW